MANSEDLVPEGWEGRVFGVRIDAPPLKTGDRLTVRGDEVEVEVALPSLRVLQDRLRRGEEGVWCPLRGLMLPVEECATACAAPEARPVCWPGERIDDATQVE